MTFTQVNETIRQDTVDFLELFIKWRVDLSTIDDENFHEKTIKEFISYCKPINVEPEFIQQIYYENVEQVLEKVLSKLKK